MTAAEPTTDPDAPFGSEGATAAVWAQARRRLEAAEVFWISTVRRDRRPHVTPLLAVWLDDALHFCTGPGEGRAGDLAADPHCILTTDSTLAAGDDLVVEGLAVRVREPATLERLADAWVRKYGPEWRFRVRGDVLVGDHEGGEALVLKVAPVRVSASGRGSAVGPTMRRSAAA